MIILLKISIVDKNQQNDIACNRPYDLVVLVMTFVSTIHCHKVRSSGCVVVKLSTCGATGPGFDSLSRRYDFRD